MLYNGGDVYKPQDCKALPKLQVLDKDHERIGRTDDLYIHSWFPPETQILYKDDCSRMTVQG